MVGVPFVTTFPGVDWLPGVAVPNGDSPIQAARSHVQAIGAPGDAQDYVAIAEFVRLLVAPPLEVVPFPPTQVGLAWAGDTLIERLLGASQVLRREFSGRCFDSLKVQSLPFMLEGAFDFLFGIDL